MEMKHHVLIVGGEADLSNLMQEYLGQYGISCSSTHTGATALQVLSKVNYDLLLCELRLEDMDSEEFFSRINTIKPDLPVIFIIAEADIKTVVKLIKMGAADCISRPIYPEELLLSINNALKCKEEKYLHSENEFMHQLIGESRQMRHIHEQIALVAPTSYRVILNGESGTGKESIAQIIHYKSKRYKQPFVAIDCGALPKHLAASELFGYEKGAFTGAVSTKEGHFEMANGGTLFLDEIANLPYEVQVSLLRVLQEKKMKRVGGRKDIPLDVRIITASNEDLSQSVQKGIFRSDLFHRLNEFLITVPPLRERKSDIMLLADHFLQRTNNELGKTIRYFDNKVKEIFLAYNWPGNVRELLNVVRKAALMTQGDTIYLAATPPEITNMVKVLSISEKLQPDTTKPNLRQKAQEAEIQVILDVLKQVNFNRTKAAQILEIDRKTLYNKIKDLDI